MFTSYCVGPPGTARLNWPVGDELGVGVEDRVGAEAGLEDVGPRLGDLEELGAEVQAALEGDVDGPVEGHSVGGPSSSGPAGISSVP